MVYRCVCLAARVFTPAVSAEVGHRRHLRSAHHSYTIIVPRSRTRVVVAAAAAARSFAINSPATSDLVESLDHLSPRLRTAWKPVYELAAAV